MAIVVPALGVAFAAFYVWLVVRIVNRRERWTKRLAVALVAALVGYPLSFGLWISIYVAAHRHQQAIDVPCAIYRPIEFVAMNSAAPIQDAYPRCIRWWLKVGRFTWDGKWGRD